MLFPPNKTCPNCGQVFKVGDAVRMTHTGTLQTVGGAGLYKDQLTLRGATLTEHEGKCPQQNGGRHV